MEIKLNEQIPVLAVNTVLAITQSGTFTLPVERSFVDALSGKKIKEAEPVEVFAAVSAAIEKCWFELGLKTVPDADFEQLKLNISKEFTDCFGSLTLNEISNAFYHGSRGKYGKVYSITVIVAGKWMADYLTDQSRLDAIKSLKPKELPAPKPSLKDQFESGKTCLWIALDKYNSKAVMGTIAPTVYNFLDDLGLIVYNKTEKWDFMAKALDIVIEDVRILIITMADEHKSAGLKRQLSLLIAAKEPDVPLNDQDCIQMIKNKAKELTLADWFATCYESEFDINELVEAKRDIYLSR